MPVSYRIFTDPDIVIVTWQGTVVLEESASNFIEYLTSGHAYSGTPVLADCSGVTKLDIDFQEMLHFVSQKLSILDPFEVSMVMGIYAPQDDVFAKWEEYVRLVSTSDRQLAAVFRTREEALGFLRIDPVALDTVLAQD
ncbi:hypothetical protein [Primorskyibacter sp. S187A]|uniref:hypothetical protein n=1 Tax=Primorskyibacter sp. S187A TaxID=3415130 RepID=UPI003C7E3BFE